MDTTQDHLSPYRADGKLYGFVCVVTGADQPLGAAISIELAAHGAACIYACASPGSASTLLTKDIQRLFPNAKVIEYPYDITSDDATLALIDEVLNSWGRLDVWVCSSGLLGPPSIDQTTPADLQRCFETNTLAPFFALKYAPPAMQKTSPKGNYANAVPKDTKYGSIIIVSSTASTYGGCWGPCYTMSCHAALGVVRSGVAVLKGTGVRINCISPGQIEAESVLNGHNEGKTTAHTPSPALQSLEQQKTHIGLERAGSPAEIAKVAGFLASGFSSYITGANLVVDGGVTAMNPIMMPA